MKNHIYAIGCALLLVMGTAMPAATTQKATKITQKATPVKKEAAQAKKPAQTNDTAFAVVSVLAQQERTLPFYKFGDFKVNITPQQGTTNIPWATNLPFISYKKETGKFEPQQPVLPIQMVPKTFTVPKTLGVKTSTKT